MTTQDIIVKIQRHPKFKDLGFVQISRVPVVAAWAAFAIQGLKTGINRDKVLRVVEKHRTHKEFNGILLDIIKRAPLKQPELF